LGILSHIFVQVSYLKPDVSRVSVVVANAGETEALIKDWRAKLYYRWNEHAFEPNLDDDIGRSEVGFWLAPGGFRVLVARFNSDEVGHDQFVAGEAEMYVVGTINYAGRDGIDRGTGFCRAWSREDGTWRIVSHSEYEYAY
jgi:hypothetical protein